MQSITLSQLAEILDRIQAPTFGYLETAAEPSMLKRGNPFLFDEIIKTRELSVLFGFNIGDAINAKRRKLGLPEDYTEQERPWGTKASPARVVHKGQNYADCQILCRWSTRYFVNGEEVPESVLSPHLPKRKENINVLSPVQFQEMDEQMALDWAAQNYNLPSSLRFDSIKYVSLNLPDGQVDYKLTCLGPGRI